MQLSEKLYGLLCGHFSFYILRYVYIVSFSIPFSLLYLAYLLPCFKRSVCEDG